MFIHVWQPRLSALWFGVPVILGLIVAISIGSASAQDETPPAEPPKTPAEPKPPADPNRPATPDMPEPDLTPEPMMPEPETAQPPLADQYGFLPLEIYKIDPDIRRLTSADIDGTGTQDLVVLNVNKNRIDFLLQRVGETAPKEEVPQTVNALSDSARLRHETLPLDRPLTATDDLLLADLNGDRLPDIVHTTRNELVWRLNEGPDPESGMPRFGASRTVRLSEGAGSATWKLAHGDLTGDGRDEVVALGGNETLVLQPDADGHLGRPDRMTNTSDRIAHVWIADLNGNGRNDLVFFDATNDEAPLIVRFADEQRRLGPEHRLVVPPARAIELVDLDGKPGQEIVLLERSTGRMRTYTLAAPAATDDLLQPAVQFGLPSASSGRAFGYGDLDGDGLTDVVLADGNTATMSVFLQSKSGGLLERVEFPGLTGIASMVVDDANSDGRSEIYLTSERERVVAVSRWMNGRLTFPEVLPSNHGSETPVGIGTADLDGDGRTELIFSTYERVGARLTSRLRKLAYDRDEGWQAAEFASGDAVTLDANKVRSAPSDIVALDADRDGRDDLVLLGERSPILYLSTSASGVPQWIESQGERLGEGGVPQVTISKLGGWAIFVAAKSFSRRFGLDATGRWAVRDQYNAESPSADITATALLRTAREDNPHIVLIDSGTKRLRILKRDDGLYRPWQALPMTTLTLKDLATADFNGDGQDDLLLVGTDRLALHLSGEASPELQETGYFETEVEKGKPSDFVAGDLGGAGEPEIALVDTGENRIELVTLRDDQWKSALRFRIFETAPSQSGGGEPRESLVTDINTDGLADLIFLAHDRVLIYRQDDGAGEVVGE
jgi:hypothetical protein